MSTAEEGIRFETTQAVSSGIVAGQGVSGGGDRDLTAFFLVGAVINVLLLAVFLVWAIGQWRKTGK